MRSRIVKLYLTDFRAGADKIHKAVDGKFKLPDKVAMVLVGGALPLALLGLMMLWHIARGGTLW